MRWHAELQSETSRPEGRAAPRRRLLLMAPATTGGGAAQVMIHNLSISGLLLETGDAIPPGESISVEIPEAGTQSAKVVWRKGRYHGCHFDKPLSGAALSAAQLRALPEESIFRQIERTDVVDRIHPVAKAAIVIGGTLTLWGGIALAIAYW